MTPPARCAQRIPRAGAVRRRINPFQEIVMNKCLQLAIALSAIGISSFAVTPRVQACGLDLVKSANGQWKIAPPARMLASAASKMMFLAAASPAATTKAIANPLQFLEPITGLYDVTLTS